jgi:hypothetical protein
MQCTYIATAVVRSVSACRVHVRVCQRFRTLRSSRQVEHVALPVGV